MHRSILIGSVLLLATACHEEEETPTELADVIYQGGANDEALELLIATAATPDATRAAVLTWPADGESIPASPVKEFWWEEGSTARAPVERLLLGPLRAAFAHGAPVNGPAYFVVFSTSTNDKLVRVFTTELSFTPDAATWQKMVDANEPVQCVITNAVFDNNLLAADGGPFVGAPTTFSITP
jgi:hypothetical protein